MSGYDLAYVALASRDVAAAAALLEDDLGLGRTDVALGGRTVPVFGVGETALALFEAGDPFLGDGGELTGVHHVALAAADPAAAVAEHGLALDPSALGAGFDGRAQTSVQARSTGGLRVRFTEPLGLSSDGAGVIERIDHLGVATDDVRRDEDVFVGNLGLAVESRQTDMEVQTAVESFTSDKYGVVYHNRAPKPVGGLRVLFVSVGDCEFEFLQDFDPTWGTDVQHGAPGTTKQDQSAIGRFVDKRGPGLHHVALKTPDINATLETLAAKGRRMIDTTGRPGSRRALIGFIHPAALGGVLVHFVERVEI